jgi:heme/copper-type cytochrome/quinol oxidase subunit 3
MSLWFSDVVGEGTFNGDHNAVVLKGLVLGMSLFILTEVIFFGFIF